MDVIKPIPESHGYTCCFVPAASSLELNDEIAKISSTELQQICLSNGWKLEFVKIDAQYLQWAISVGQTVTVRDIILQVRSDLNKKILSVFKKQDLNPPPNFWAGGYLLLHGLIPDPKEVIERYILLIRRQSPQ